MAYYDGEEMDFDEDWDKHVHEDGDKEDDNSSDEDDD